MWLTSKSAPGRHSAGLALPCCWQKITKKEKTDKKLNPMEKIIVFYDCQQSGAVIKSHLLKPETLLILALNIIKILISIIEIYNRSGFTYILNVFDKSFEITNITISFFLNLVKIAETIKDRFSLFFVQLKWKACFISIFCFPFLLFKSSYFVMDTDVKPWSRRGKAYTFLAILSSIVLIFTVITAGGINQGNCNNINGASCLIAWCLVFSVEIAQNNESVSALISTPIFFNIFYYRSFHNLLYFIL